MRSARHAAEATGRDIDAAADALIDAKVLVALGELAEAERITAARVELAPDDLTALNLFAKIKHMKGELSQAVACWAHLHARSPHNELALMRLATLLQLARDPELHAADFVALRHAQLAHSPAVLELETAFRELLARRTDDARATCERLAARHRHKDKELYKLCVMAKAWIAELSGEVDSARRTLEDLGEERGFETDTDRVLALARIYERLAERPHLEKAVHVHRWLDRSFEKISAQSRLASLCRKLGRDAEADEHERLFRLAFERRMHRPSRSEIARAAARRFFPLDRLETIRTSSDTSRGPLETASSRAVFDFLSGDRASARAHLEHGDTVLDRKYLGSLRALEGDLEGAVDLFLRALREDPTDAKVASFLLGVHEHDREGARGTRIASVLRTTALGARVRASLERALERNPRAPFLWHATSELLRVQEDSREAARRKDRALALDDARARDEHPIGRVLAAAVYRFVGKSKGLVHQVWADRKPTSPGRGGFLQPDDILGNLTAEMRQAVRNTFLAVREYARSRFPHLTADILDYDYAYKVTKEDETSGGLSAGLPTALAFLSVFLQRPIPQDVAFSGVVVADAHDVLVVRSVGDAALKVKAAYNRDLRCVVLPADNRFDLAESTEIPRHAREEMVRFAASLDDALTLTFGDGVWLA